MMKSELFALILALAPGEKERPVRRSWEFRQAAVWDTPPCLVALGREGNSIELNWRLLEIGDL